MNNQISQPKGPLLELIESDLDVNECLQKALEMSTEALGDCNHCKEGPTYSRREIIRLLERSGAYEDSHRLVACADCAGVGHTWVVVEADGTPKFLVIYKQQEHHAIDIWVYPPGG